MSLPTCVTISGALLVLGCNDAASGPNETQALLARDRHWASLAAATSPNPDSVVAYWTDDARVVLPGQPVLTGKAAVRAMVTATTKIPGFHVTWTPDSAVVSRSGDLAYTYGVNEFTRPIRLANSSPPVSATSPCGARIPAINGVAFRTTRAPHLRHPRPRGSNSYRHSAHRR